MKRHGFTVLGRSVSEAYHRTCVLVSEIKRNIIVEMLCAANGKTPETVTDEEMAYMATPRQFGDVSAADQEEERNLIPPCAAARGGVGVSKPTEGS